MKQNMKIGIILIMIFLSRNTFAQTNEMVSEKIKTDKVTETYLDVLLNLVSTNVNYGKSNSDFSNYKKSVFGAQLGASFQAGITPTFSLVPEVYFIMKGGKLEENNPLTGKKTTLRLYTVELPILARFHFGKFYANAGPSIAYSFYGTKKIEGSSTESLFKNSGGDFKRLDAGVQAGAGYRFKVKQRNVSLDVRYTYGLINISNGSQEMYNRYLNISLHLSNPWKTNPLVRNKKS